MTLPRVGLDLDGFLIDTFTAFTQYYNEKHGTKFTERDVAHPETHVRFGVGKEYLHSVMCEFEKTVAIDGLALVEGAADFVNNARKFCDPVIITSRPDNLVEPTRRSINKHFPSLVQHTYFARNRFHASTFERETKADICVRLGVRAMADDDNAYALHCAQNGIRAYWFRPHTIATQEHPLLHPVHSFDEILGLIRAHFQTHIGYLHGPQA